MDVLANHGKSVCCAILGLQILVSMSNQKELWQMPKVVLSSFVTLGEMSKCE